MQRSFLTICLLISACGSNRPKESNDGLVKDRETSIGASEDCPLPQRADSEDYEDGILPMLEGGSGIITSVQQFLDCLPETYFEYGMHTYLKASLAPEAPDISRELPGAILFGTTGRTIIRYVGRSDGRYADEIRIIAQDGAFPVSNRFVSVFFNGSGTLPTVLESDATCISCHKGRYNWGNYREWNPQAFGGGSDLEWVEKDTEDYFDYTAFLRSQADNPRYRRGVAADWRGDEYGKLLAGGRMDTRNPFAPGAGHFLDAVVFRQARYVADKLMSHPAYPAFKYFALSTFLDCRLNPAVEAETNEVLQGAFGSDPLWKSYRSKTLPNRGFDSHEGNDYNVAKLVLAGRVLGISIDEWATSFKNDNLLDWYLDGPGFDLGSGKEMRDYVLRAWLDRIKKQDPESLPPGVKDRRFDFSDEENGSGYASLLHKYYNARYAVQYGSPSGYGKECSELASFVEAESRVRSGNLGWTLAGLAAPAYRVDTEKASRAAKTREFLKSEIGASIGYTATVTSCFACHTHGMGPDLPFSDPEAFRNWLSSRHTFNKKTYLGVDLIRERVLSRRDMPRDEGLTDSERDRIIQELENFLSE